MMDEMPSMHVTEDLLCDGEDEGPFDSTDEEEAQVDFGQACIFSHRV